MGNKLKNKTKEKQKCTDQQFSLQPLLAQALSPSNLRLNGAGLTMSATLSQTLATDSWTLLKTSATALQMRSAMWATGLPEISQTSGSMILAVALKMPGAGYPMEETGKPSAPPWPEELLLFSQEIQMLQLLCGVTQTTTLQTTGMKWKRRKDRHKRMKQKQEGITLSSFRRNKHSLIPSCPNRLDRRMLTALPCQADRESLTRLEEHSKTGGLDKLETLPSTLVGHLDPMLLAFTMICLLDTSPKLHVKQLIASILATVLLMKPAATCACLMPGQRSEEEEISSHSLM